VFVTSDIGKAMTFPPPPLGGNSMELLELKPGNPDYLP
jgi:hypothetical protein